jgi:hypothetical protein
MENVEMVKQEVAGYSAVFPQCLLLFAGLQFTYED